ncbi:MAG TPA: branched-chain amino acid ABC transporter permease [Methanothrix sp.]|nr:branched-chain amino acid ABC transporter permease [Methanothrix sp.]
MISQLFLNSLIAGSIYALIAIGFAVIYKTVKFFHFAHGAVYASGAYIAYTFFQILQINFIVSFFLATISAGIIGLGIYQLVYHTLQLKKVPNLIYLLASFGVFIFIQNLIALIYGSQVLIIRSGLGESIYSFLGAAITLTQITIIVISLTTLIALWIFIEKTKLGLALRAVADDSQAAQLVGIDSLRLTQVSFFIGSILAGVAGVLISLDTNLSPTMGLTAIFKGLIACIIGGIGSIPGAVVGGFFLGFVENFGIWYISSIWQDSISFVVLIIFLIFRPRGFFGIIPEKELI